MGRIHWGISFYEELEGRVEDFHGQKKYQFYTSTINLNDIHE